MRSSDVKDLIDSEIKEEMLRTKDIIGVLTRHQFLSEPDTGLPLESQAKNIPEQLPFDVEFYKFGKSFNTLLKRWAVITRNALWSSKQPVANFSMKDATNKTDCLPGATFTIENKNQKYNRQFDWKEQKKPMRIIIEFIDRITQKRDYFFLYLETDKQVSLVLDMLYAIRIRTKEEALVSNNKLTQKIIEGGFLFYAVAKIREAARAQKKRKILLNSMKSYTLENLTEIIQFGGNVMTSFIKAFRPKKKMKGEIYPKKKVLITTLPDFQRDMHKPLTNFTLVENVKKAISIIIQSFRRIFHTATAISTREEVSFKIEEKISVASMREFIPPIDPEKIQQCQSCTVNIFQNPEVRFSNECSLSQNHIVDITNVILNSSQKFQMSENEILLLGPKVDKWKCIRYAFNSEASKRYPGKFKELGDTNTLDNHAHKILCIQIFHAILLFEKSDIEYYQYFTDTKIQSEKDFYYFITMTINNSQKFRTKLFPPTKYENNKLVIEFNLQFLISLNEFNWYNQNNIGIRLGLNIIPAKCFDINLNEKERNFYLDYLNFDEMRYCVITKEKIDEKAFDFPLFKDGIVRPLDDRIIINFIEEKEEEVNLCDLIRPYNQLSIGSDFYSIESLNKGFFEAKMKDETIDLDIRENIFNVKFSDDGAVLLRPDERLPENEFISRILQSAELSMSDLKGILHNRRFKFLPMCEIFSGMESLSKSKNMHLNKEEICESSICQGEWIYKLMNVNKHFLGKLIGINVDGTIFYENLFKHEDISRNYSHELIACKNIVQIQDNMFHVLDLSQIDIFSIENADNYQWTIAIKFAEKKDMCAFLANLKNLRRRANFLEKMDRDILYKASPINDIKLVGETFNSVRHSTRFLRIVLDQIEFTQNFTLRENVKLMIRLTKVYDDIHLLDNRRSILETLDETDLQEYSNSISIQKHVRSAIDLMKRLRPREYSLSFDLNNQVQGRRLSFNSKISDENKIFEIECNTQTDKEFLIEIILKGNRSSEMNMFTQVNLRNVINLTPSADYIIVPVQFDKCIVGALQIKAWCVNWTKDALEKTFEDEISKVIKENKSSLDLNDPYGYQIAMGTYEPNSYTRKMRKKINSLVTNDDRNSNSKIIHSFSRKMKFLRKMELHRKQSEFHQQYFHSTADWEIFFSKFYMDIKGSSMLSDELFSLFPNKDEILRVKTAKDDLKSLVYKGIPQNARLEVWYKLLDIDKLVSLTKDRLNNPMMTMENIYYYYQSLVEKQEEHHNSFKLIDGSSSNATIKIKMITKCYFLWTGQNIRLNKGNTDSKYVFFPGMINLIQRFYSVFKFDYEIFWLIIGLAQVIDIFFQSNPLYNKELNFSSTCILYLQTLMKLHLEKVFKHMLVLRFPFEMFISKLISTMFSDYFQTELFLWIFDILIFESSLNNSDRQFYLRFFCAIPISLIQLNENKIISCRYAYELEIVFEDMIRKSYNTPHFIEILIDNLRKFYPETSFFQSIGSLFDRSSEKTFWEISSKAANSILESFSTIESENKAYLKKITMLDPKFMRIYHEQLRKNFTELKKIFSESSRTIHAMEYSVEKKYCIVFQFMKLHCFTMLTTLPKELILLIKYSNGILSPSAVQRDNSISVRLEYDSSSQSLSTMFPITGAFETCFPNFINMFLYSESMTTFISSFILDIKQIDLMRPFKFQLESNDNVNKSVIELGILKYSAESVVEDNYDLFNFVFSKPLIPEENETESQVLSSSMISSIASILRETNAYLIQRINSFANKDESMQVRLKEFKRNYMPHSTMKATLPTNILPQLEKLLKSLFTEDISQILLKWLMTSSSSCEELIYSIILTDSFSVTPLDKLELLYNAARTKNLLLFKSECLHVEKMKELAYSLYKRYMISFTKSDVDRMVDYILNKDCLLTLKCAVVYNSKDSQEIEKYLKDHIESDTNTYDHIEDELTRILNYLRIAYNMKSIPAGLMTVIVKEIFNKSDDMYLNKGYDMVLIETVCNNLISIRKYEIFINIEDGSVEVRDVNENQKSFLENSKFDDPHEDILRMELNSVELYNTYSDGFEISFEKFQEIFLQLPFLYDMISISIGFTAGKFEEKTRNSLGSSSIPIAIPWDRPCDITSQINEPIMICKHGFAKLYLTPSLYEWRQCTILVEPDVRMRVTFRTFHHSYVFNYIEEDVIIEEE